MSLRSRINGVLSRANLPLIAFLAVLVSLDARAAAQAPCRYEIAHIVQVPDCGLLPNGANALGISPNGRYVVGAYGHCPTETAQPYVLDMQTGQLTPIPKPAGIGDATPKDVNDAGLVVGDSVRFGVGDRGFVYDIHTGQWTEVQPIHPQGWSFAKAVNKHGKVCGQRSIGSPGDPVNPRTAYVWSQAEGYQDLGPINSSPTEAFDINDDNWVAGRMYVNQIDTPFLWRGEELLQLPYLAGMSTVPLALDNSLRVVGSGRVPMKGFPAGVSHAFLYADGTIMDLGALPGDITSVAWDISGNGVACGFSRSDRLDSATVWDATGICNVNDRIDSNDGPWLVEAAAISHSGSMAVIGLVQNRSVGVVLVPMNITGDVTADCRVDISDVLFVVGEWNQIRSPADLTNDGIVGIADLIFVIQNWTPL